MKIDDVVIVDAEMQAEHVAVRIRFRHEMLSGYGLDRPTDIPVAPKYIQQLIVRSDDKVVFQAYLSPALSADPFFSFVFSGAAKGDALMVFWQENTGKKYQRVVIVQ